ncbi:MAG: hemoglobin, partial [Oleispira sp.]
PKFFNYCLIVISAQLALGCSSNSVQQDSSLYHAIGGHDGIERIVDAFTLRIVQDKSILPYFLKSNVTHFKQGFISHLCDAVGGPCQYKGDTMHDIHTGMKITEKDFNRTVELLIDAMEDAGIDYRSQNKILKQLAPSRKTIIKI